ncbi:glutathionylspermidine synthase family protein [Granulicella sp. WH15]|uniref:glutathionylspermidine synthase family protein n=1 Tax=Granulicella sp. WH15 TaxID=2602070 RepID=UPI001367264A|nr:glutathionylspermidine synthase family protein [Granulicella sp. WH15]QHN04644.1 glutathionylspermidine synthase family protein [Granulicella sp. WH15]
MQRVSIAARPDWQKKVEAQGLTFHSPAAMAPQPYWDESACYKFSAAEIDTLEAVGSELQGMCLAAAQHVIDKQRYAELGIPANAAPVIEWAWNQDPPSIYGRFDILWAGASAGSKWGATAPKLLEYNADTPTSLLEAAVVQGDWLDEVGRSLSANPDQFNTIHERLIERWQSVVDALIPPVYFAALDDPDEPEDLATTTYLRDTADQAGLHTEAISLQDIGWNPDRECFVDLEENQIFSIFKQYPWESMLGEDFGPQALDTYADVRWIEPIWKLLLSNKGLLPILWELYPGHPLLLEAYFDEPRRMGSYVRKPIYSRDGANVSIIRPNMRAIEMPGPYGDGRFICQSLAPEVVFAERHPVLGLWMIGEECCGMGIRESAGLITDKLSSFVPHYFE